MRSLIVFVVLITFALGCFCGCSFKNIRHGTALSEDEVAQIVDGKTTKDDVYLLIGEPKKILEDGRVFVYNWVRGSKSSFLGLGAGTAYGHSLIVTFDENNIVKAHRITRGEVEHETGIGD